MKILLQTTGKPMRNGKENPKIPPTEWWDNLKDLLKDHEVRILPEILTWPEMEEYVQWADISIVPDSYWQHLCWYMKKPCIVIFSQSDPLIFGHKENINVLKDTAYLRSNQYGPWEDAQHNPQAFVSPITVFDIMGGWKQEMLKSNNTQS